TVARDSLGLFKSKETGGDRKDAARRAVCVVHYCGPPGDNDLGVAHSRGVSPVHAVRIRTTVWTMGAVKRTEPADTSDRVPSKRFGENFSSRLLRAGFVEAGGKPGAGFPVMVAAFESAEVPAPSDDGAVGGENADEMEWIDALQGQVRESLIHCGG